MVERLMSLPLTYPMRRGSIHPPVHPRRIRLLASRPRVPLLLLLPVGAELLHPNRCAQRDAPRFTPDHSSAKRDTLTSEAASPASPAATTTGTAGA